MIKLIPGKRGTGKTKILVDLIKEAAKNTRGNVVCIEKAMQLTYDIPYSVRLVDVYSYSISSYDKLYGFISGMIAGNYDISEVFVDGILKIGGRDYDDLGEFLAAVEKITSEIEVVLTVSEDVDNLPESVTKYAK